MSLASLIRAGRKGVKNARLGVLGDYLRRLRSAIGNDEAMAKEFGTSVPAIDAAIKSAKGHLTWFDPEHASPVAVGTKDGAVPTWTGQRLSKAEGSDALAEGSILDFECIATTARRDRDGDVLEPKGAIVDPKLPLLWQHMPFSPIGRMTTLLDQDEKRVAMRCCVLDTLLGRDAATLIRGGALRISHGFAPIEYNPLKDDAGKDMGGWRISKYAMMEVSVVSIPSNVDAEITAFSGGKLHHPIVKGWCETLFRNRTKTVTSGFDPSSGKLELTINLNGLDIKGAAQPAGKKAAGADGVQDDDEDDEEDKNAPDGDKPWVCEGCGQSNAADSAACGNCDLAKPKAADDGSEGEGEGEGDPEDDGGEEEGGKGMTLGEIREAISGLAKSGSLPKEAQRRLAVAEGMLEDVDASFEEHGGEIAKALKDRDLAGVFGHCSAMYESTCNGLRGVAEELDRIAGVNGLDETAVGSIAEVGKSAMQIADAVSTMAGIGGGAGDINPDPDDDEAPDLTAEAGAAEGDGDDDEEEEEGKESDEDYSDEEEEDEDDSEIDEEEDEDEEEKSDDSDDDDEEDDEFEEKDESFGENPEADLTDEQDEDNPGVDPKGKGRGAAKQKTGAASLATRLSGELIGGATLDAETRQLLAGLLGDPADR